MVPNPKTFDVSKSGKTTELTETKHRFGILVEFPYNIAYRKGFGISTGNTTYGQMIKPIVGFKQMGHVTKIASIQNFSLE